MHNARVTHVFRLCYACVMHALHTMMHALCMAMLNALHTTTTHALRTTMSNALRMRRCASRTPSGERREEAGRQHGRDADVAADEPSAQLPHPGGRPGEDGDDEEGDPHAKLPRLRRGHHEGQWEVTVKVSGRLRGSP